jgi:ankyrin repeat protein
MNKVRTARGGRNHSTTFTAFATIIGSWDGRECLERRHDTVRIWSGPEAIEADVVDGGPLLRAAQTFDNDVVRLLLQHGAKVDLPNASGVTPFMAAAGIGTRTAAGVTNPGVPDNVVTLSLETMEILRAAGADVNARITDVTSLTARIARGKTMTGRQGQTALFTAAESGRTAVVKYLLEHGANAELRDNAGRRAVDVARGETVAPLRASSSSR